MMKRRNVVELSWDAKKPYKKGDKFHFNWPSIDGRTKGYAIAIEDFIKVKLSNKEAKEIDTHSGVHYYGKAIAHYN